MALSAFQEESPLFRRKAFSFGKLIALLAGLLSLGVFVTGCGKEQGKSVTQTVVKTTEIEVVRAKDFRGSALPTANLFRLYSPAVVSVFAVIEGEIGEFGDRRRGIGSGFIINANGEIVTTTHAITRETDKDLREASEVYVRLQTGEELPAEIVGIDPVADVALLRINPAGLRLRLVRFDSKQLSVGESIVTIGAPLQEPHTFSKGSISGLDRSITTITGFPFPFATQTDAPVNLANAGGPALSTSGKVVGLLTEARTTQGSGDGVGFFIPSANVMRSVRALQKSGEVKYPFLGVTAVDVFPAMSKHFKLGARFGVWVQELAERSPAEEAGIKASTSDEREAFNGRSYLTGGDVILRFAGKKVKNERQFARLLLSLSPGVTVEAVILRDGKKKSVQMKLQKRPEVGQDQ